VKHGEGHPMSSWVHKRKLVLLKIGGDPNISVPEPISTGFERGELTNLRSTGSVPS
jgi:hypothetical protein